MSRSSKAMLLLSFLVLPINNVVSQTIFAVVGDYGDGSSDELAVAAMINSWEPAFIVTVGDNYYGSSSQIDHEIGIAYADWIKPYSGVYGSDTATVNRFFPAIGNHEYYHALGPQAYMDYFSWLDKAYYDFVIDNVHFFILDHYNGYSSSDNGYEQNDGTDSASDQALWFYNQIDACVANHLHWRVVVTHIPPYSSDKDEEWVRWPYKGHGAHVLISGHSHTYERIIIDDFPYIVNGLGGKSIYSFGSTIEGSEAQYNSDYGAQLVTVDGTEMKLEFWSVGTAFSYVPQLQDTWTITEGALPVELAFFTGSQNGNNVELRWRTETEVNNYGFELERSAKNTDWRYIGFVEGHGNSNSPKQYNFSDTEINQSGTYYYRLKQIDSDGTYEYSDVVDVEVGVPNDFYLGQNYPNPFNPETRIDYTLPEKQLVSLKVYNTLGELVGELVNEEKEAGSYSVTLDGSNIPSGVYIYRLQTSSFAANKKMTLLK